MSASKTLPASPSLESLRKQAKKLARDIAAGDAGAIARTREQLPNVELPLTQRNAQLVIAREYGFPGWQDLTAEVSKRLVKGLEWAAARAKAAIHDNDVERLTKLLDEFPALLSWQGDDDDSGLLGMATGSYGDSFDPDRERNYTRAECAELLIDRGAVVAPAVFEGLIESRARGLLQLFRRKGLLPRTLEYFAALGDLDAIRRSLGENGHDLATVNKAFMRACRFQHEDVASVLLERSIALDPELGKHVDGSIGRRAFVRFFMEQRALAFVHATPAGPWQEFLMEQVMRAVSEGDLTTFVSELRREPWLLGEDNIGLQVGIIERAVMRDRPEFIEALLDLDPALRRRQPPPRSQATEFAITYAKPHLIPLLTRVWPLPDDLPHASAVGDLTKVKRWFDESGAPMLGDLGKQYPLSDRERVDLQWSAQSVQQVLDIAFAWSVINRHFDVADFLLEHGADINTTWSSHEPASILHELVFHGNYESMRYLIDHGIDMTIQDYRWHSTARGWAFYAAKDEKMAQWLDDAERLREQSGSAKR